MEGACHKRIVGYSVAEHNELCAANRITVSSACSRRLDNLAHLLYCVHVDAALRRADADGGADNVRNSQSLRNRSDEIAVALRIALVNQRREAADKVYADLLACLVQRLRQRHIISAVTAFANHRNRRYRDTLVDDRHAHLHLDILAGFYQMLCLLADFVINFLRRNLDIRMTAITQADAHRNRAHIQLIFGNHARSF